MKVFISHSGERSKALAERIQWFVRNLVPSTEPWLSSGIEKGSRWEPEIAAQLEASGVGIVCLTAENLDSRWILFESGALAKRLDGRVCTLLLGIEPAEVKPPLGQFQHTRAERDDVWQLVETINNAVAAVGEKPRPADDLRESFDLLWPKLETTINELRAQAPTVPHQPRARPVPEMLAELLDLVREGGGRLDNVALMQRKMLEMIDRMSEVAGADNSAALRALWSLTIGGEPPVRQSTERLRREMLLRELAKGQPSMWDSLAAQLKTLKDEGTPSPRNLRSEGEDPKE